MKSELDILTELVKVLELRCDGLSRDIDNCLNELSHRNDVIRQARAAKSKAENAELDALAMLDDCAALLKELTTFAENWLPDEAKESWARDLIKRAKDFVDKLERM